MRAKSLDGAQVRMVSMAQWCALARENAAPPVTIPLDGDSMRPLIRRGRDLVTIVPLQRPLKRGDVVLFTLGDGRYIVHRVWKLRGNFVRTLGDNCFGPEPWFPREQVLGQVIGFQRDGRHFSLATPLSRALGKGWMALRPLRNTAKRCWAWIGHCVRKILPAKRGV